MNQFKEETEHLKKGSSILDGIGLEHANLQNRFNEVFDYMFQPAGDCPDDLFEST